jgi:hypothetical protein
MASVNDTSIFVERMDADVWGETTSTASTGYWVVTYLLVVVLGVVSMGASSTKGYTNSNPNKGISIGSSS